MAIEGLGGMMRGLETQSGVRGVSDPSGLNGVGEGQASSEGGFANVLSKAVGELEATYANAEGQAMNLVTGQQVAVHEVMAAATEAEIAVQMTSAIAVKAIAAYQEIWRMEI
jgi:flagellar hook-basal body complex protein FliE